MKGRHSAPDPTVAAISGLGLLPQSLDAGILTLPDGRQRAILEVSPINVGLLSEEASDALETGYLGVLAGLTFPVQLLACTRLATAAPYLAHLRALLARETEPHLLRLLVDHLAHVERSVATAAPLERRFYVVVPAPETRLARRSPFPLRLWRGGAPTAGDDQDGRGVLAERCAALGASLSALGLRTRRLDTPALAELLYAGLCPRLSRLQPLEPRMLATLELPIATTRRHRGGRHGALPA